MSSNRPRDLPTEPHDPAEAAYPDWRCPRCGALRNLVTRRYPRRGLVTQYECPTWWFNHTSGQVDACGTGGEVPAEVRAAIAAGEWNSVAEYRKTAA